MSQKKLNISAIIIAKNEQERLARCIASLAFCQEIIVVDNNSNDQTKKEAQQHNATVITKSGDFATLRNEGKAVAHGKWLLYVDADEIVSSELATEIVDITSGWKQGKPQAYELKRKNYYLGFPWPEDEYMKRLFHQEALVEWKGSVHETAVSLGVVGRLNGTLIHDTHRNLEQMVDKTNQWSDIEAKLRFDAQHPVVTWWRLIRVMLTGFWDSYVIQKGYRAGVVGWIESIYQSFSLFVTYAKLWELQQSKAKEQ